jgi:DNA-binding response OmpR family regulator
VRASENVVDDEETIVEFLTMGLENAGFEVTAAQDGRTALLEAERQPPDLVVLDWMLPGLDGLQVCRTLRARSQVPILMLTAKAEVDDRVEGLESGADDYLPKPFRFKELLARVRALLRRSNASVQRVLHVADVSLNRDTRETIRAGKLVSLTQREFDLLELLMSRPRHVFTRERILDRLWGYDFGGDTNVIDVHVSALREKLGDRDRTLIRTVRGVGFTLRP